MAKWGSFIVVAALLSVPSVSRAIDCEKAGSEPRECQNWFGYLYVGDSGMLKMVTARRNWNSLEPMPDLTIQLSDFEDEEMKPEIPTAVRNKTRLLTRDNALSGEFKVCLLDTPAPRGRKKFANPRPGCLMKGDNFSLLNRKNATVKFK